MDKEHLVYSQKAVAAAFQVNTVTVTFWRRKGMPVKRTLPGHNKLEYDLRDIALWRAKRDAATLLSRTPVPKGDEFAALDTKALNEDIEQYKVNRADILAASGAKSMVDQTRIRNAKLSNMSDKELEKITHNEAIGWFRALGLDMAIKYDKERLERGESTENVAVITKYRHGWKQRNREISDGA